MSYATIALRQIDTGLIADNFNLYVWKTASGDLVSTFGWSMYEFSSGLYGLSVPLVTEQSTFYIEHKTDPDITCIGSLGDEFAFALGTWAQDVPADYAPGTAGYEMGRIKEVIDTFVVTIGQLISHTYRAGVVSMPEMTAPGGSMILFEDTDNDNIRFTVGIAWHSYLQDPDTQIWYSLKRNPRETSLILDAQGSVYDIDNCICNLNLTAAQMNITPGEYFWQLQLRKAVVTGTPPNTTTTIQRRIALEGKVLVKPTFKVT